MLVPFAAIRCHSILARWPDRVLDRLLRRTLVFHGGCCGPVISVIGCDDFQELHHGLSG